MRASATSGLTITLLLAMGPTVSYAADIIHAGPLYSSATGGSALPVFPNLELAIAVPPGTPLEALRPENFTIQVDGGAAQRVTGIRTLQAAGYGVAVAVAFDASGSMRGRPLNAVRNGLGQFVNDAGAEDRVALETIADDSRWDSDWGDSRENARDAISRLAGRGSLTRLWDGLLEAIQKFPAAPTARRILVISDGHDEGSVHTLDEVISAARAAGVVVDAIGITRSDPKFLENLSRLAAATEGHFRRATTTAEIEQFIGQGIRSVRSIPIAAFTVADLKPDGRPHAFEATWTHDGVSSSDTLTASVPDIPAAAKPPDAQPPGGPGSGDTLTSKPQLIWIAVAAALLLVSLLAVLIVRARTVTRQASAAEKIAQSSSPSVVPPLDLASRVTAPPPEPASYLGSVLPLVPAAPASEAHLAPSAPEIGFPSPRKSTSFGAYFPEPAKGHPAAWLFCDAGSEAGGVFPIDEREYWIGSLDNNHLSIASDLTVSANHACIVFDRDALGIYDHQSTNGTWLNNERLSDTRRLLRPGDRIRIGTSQFVLRPAKKEPA